MDGNISYICEYVHQHYLGTTKKHLKFLFIPLKLHGCLTPVTEGNCSGHLTKVLKMNKTL